MWIKMGEGQSERKGTASRKAVEVTWGALVSTKETRQTLCWG